MENKYDKMREVEGVEHEMKGEDLLGIGANMTALKSVRGSKSSLVLEAPEEEGEGGSSHGGRGAQEGTLLKPRSEAGTSCEARRREMHGEGVRSQARLREFCLAWCRALWPDRSSVLLSPSSHPARPTFNHRAPSEKSITMISSNLSHGLKFSRPRGSGERKSTPLNRYDFTPEKDKAT